MRTRPLCRPLGAALPLLAALTLCAAGGSGGAAEAVAPAPAALAPAPAEGPAPPAEARTAADCARCHARIAEEWRASFHARSTAATNPLYRLLLEKARGALGPNADAACGRCHAPALAGGGAASGEGVTCLVCHDVPPGHPEVRLADGRRARLLGARDGRGGADGTCLRCHDVLPSPEGHPVCTTGPEAARAGAGNCTDCHMPERKGAPTEGGDAPSHADHRFPGGRSADLLRSAATLALAVEGEGPSRAVAVTVAPGEVGHAVPTGAPLRSLVLTVTVLDADGRELWRNHAGDPLTDAPEALFQHVLSDAQGRRPVPAFLAHGPGDDRRLQPGAGRVVRYPLPPGAARVRAALTHHLAPAKVLEAAGAPPEWREPLPVAAAEAAVRP